MKRMVQANIKRQNYQTSVRKTTLWPPFMDGVQLPQG